jgi:hypothetical protein
MLELRTLMNFPAETKPYLTLPMFIYYVLSDVADFPENQNYFYYTRNNLLQNIIYHLEHPDLYSIKFHLLNPGQFSVISQQCSIILCS